MKSTHQIEITAGLFLLVAIGALVFLAVQATGAGGVLSGGSYQVTAQFSNVGGLQPGASVNMAGVPIGVVDEIMLDPESLAADVTMSISGRYDALPRDTSAAIYTSGILGDQYVGLQPGGLEKPLTDGDSIMLTQSAVILEQLIGKYLFSSQDKQGDES